MPKDIIIMNLSSRTDDQLLEQLEDIDEEIRICQDDITRAKLTLSIKRKTIAELKSKQLDIANEIITR